MGSCIFKTDEIKRCVQHALNSKKWSMGWSEEKPQPAILFVHDEGVYCMSNGEPRDLADDGKKCFTAYAAGCDPRTDEDYYDEARFLVGGDDFGETIPVDKQWLLNCDEFSEMVIEVTESDMSVVFQKPRMKQAV